MPKPGRQSEETNLLALVLVKSCYRGLEFHRSELNIEVVLTFVLILPSSRVHLPPVLLVKEVCALFLPHASD
ncbi:hypothetical protein Q5P01_005844 [Channa striata]|uniref:Uncharacterized protein n=1 Tax=Channa striata TaxID=64152 RepID=A0AA88SZW0_CHASR|nr:hypothetical protein Q5P01_005844 [Channa striata]